MTNINHLSTTLQQVLNEQANALARSSGFIQRQRQLTGASFVQTLTFGWLAHPEASLDQLVHTAATLGLKITPQSLDERFSGQAARLLEGVLARATEALIRGAAVDTDLIGRFNGVYLLDTSVIGLPAALEACWRGVGGNTPEAGRAALKIEVLLNLQDGHLRGPLLMQGRTHDMSGLLAAQTLPSGSLRITDLGYFSAGTFAQMQVRGCFWLSRLKACCTLYDASGQVLDVLDLVRQAEAAGRTHVECPVQLGLKERIGCRLIAERVCDEVANRRRRTHRRAMQKKGSTASARRLSLCSWTLLVTNVPAERLSLAEALSLYRARWQVELLFKRFKQYGGVGRSRSQNPWRILCEVYAKLIAMLVAHWITLTGLWGRAEKSLVKGQQVISAHAIHLAVSLSSVVRLRRCLALVAHVLQAGCRMNSRRSRPNTYQCLNNPQRCLLS